MSEKDDGGPAFPRTGEGFGNPAYDTPGMTLRDWFAGQALSGVLALVGSAQFAPSGQIGEPEIAAQAYAFADALLNARKANP